MALQTVKMDAGSPQPAAESAPAPGASAAAAPAAKAGGSGGMRKKILMGVAAVVGLGVLWMGGDWLLNGRFNISTDNAYVGAQKVLITPDISGKIGRVVVREGQRVTQGQLIGRLGNSGDSFAPHVHHQLQDGPSWQSASGLPCRYSNITNQRLDRGEFFTAS